jgi:hypothetical protein
VEREDRRALGDLTAMPTGAALILTDTEETA